MASALIPAPHEGKEFLASSHYKISQDERFLNNSMKSTFHNDYLPIENVSKPGAALPPRPAQFMHRDSEKVNSDVTETREEYPAKQSFNDDPRDKYSSLYKTNFKMNSDERIDSFTTTHGHYFQPNHISSRKSTGDLGRKWTKSEFPQGDKEKADAPLSVYRGSFPGHDTSQIKVKRILSQHGIGRQTLIGDNNARYATTHDTAYTGSWNEPAKPVAKHTRSSVPCGDKEKVVEDMSTMRRSFQPKQTQHEFQDNMKTYQKLYGTNYTLKDGHGTFDKYISTQTDHFQPIWLGSVEKFKRDRDRNASDIPEGDTDPYRSGERTDCSVARSHYKPLNLREAGVEHVNGANIRTVSKVQLGEKGLESRFYDTTCDSTYKAVSVPYRLAPSHPKSIVPLDYYGDLKTSPTTWSDFRPHHRPRLNLDQDALDNLRKSHFSPPLGGDRYFETSHASQFTPKQISKIAVDPGWLQRSAVPIGTMGKFIKGCHNGWE